MQTSTKFTESYFPAEEVGELIEMTLPDLMMKIAGEVPDRLALVEGVADPAKRRRWTYKQLMDDVQKVARGLLTHLQPGDKVAILAPETPEWVIMQHGLCFAGLIIVPLNPSYTEREVEFVLKSSDASAIVFAESSRGKDLRKIVEAVQARLPNLKTAVCILDIEALKAAGDPARQLPERWCLDQCDAAVPYRRWGCERDRHVQPQGHVCADAVVRPRPVPGTDRSRALQQFAHRPHDDSGAAEPP